MNIKILIIIASYEINCKNIPFFIDILILPLSTSLLFFKSVNTFNNLYKLSAETVIRVCIDTKAKIIGKSLKHIMLNITNMLSSILEIVIPRLRIRINNIINNIDIIK